MRAHEFITEGKKAKKKTGLRKDQSDAMPGAVQMRDVGGYDRTYHLNRIMMAVASADGSNKKLDSARSSWAEKYNTAHPYTDIEMKMVKQALKTVPSEHHTVISDTRSIESDGTNKSSPILAFKGYGK